MNSINIQDLVKSYNRLHRLTNYMSLAMLYLKDNFFLYRELTKDDLKKRVLGHWGTVPGLNFI